MVELQNCWEFIGCGREPGGENVDEMGVCPAAVFEPADGFCGGKNAGRGCVYVTGTFCGGYIQGTHKDKKKNCVECDFYHMLVYEHGSDMSVLRFTEYVNRKKDVEFKF